MLANLKLSQKVIFLVCIPLAFELLLIGAIYALFQDAEKEMDKTQKSREIVSRVNSVLSDIFQLSIRHKHVSRQDSVLEKLRIYNDLMAELDTLEKLCEDNSDDRLAIDNVRQICQETANVHSGPPVDSTKKHQQDLVFHARLTSFISRVKNNHEKIELESARIAQKKRHQIVEFLIGGTVLNVAFALTLVFIFNRSLRFRIEHLMENTRRLALGKSPKPPIEGKDELAVLDNTFNSVAKLLLATTSRQNSIFENAADVICLVDEKGGFIQVSDSAIDTWQYSPEELKELSIFDLVVADELNSTREAFLSLIKDDARGNIETRMSTRNGPILNVAWSISRVREASEYVLVIKDITVQKQEEELLIEGEKRLKAIIEQMPVGLIICNSKGIVKFLNPLAEQMFACSNEKVFDWRINELFESENQEEILKLLKDSMGKPHVTTGKRVDSETFPAEISASTFNTIEGQNILITVIDITEKEKLEKLKKQFVAMVSHELKTPITSVQNYIQCLEEGIYGTLNPKGNERLPNIERNLNRLIDLVNELVLVEKLESKTLSLKKSDIEVQDLLDLAAENIRTLAQKNNIEMDIEESPLRIHADLDRLVQVIINLCSNAIKFSNPGSKLVIKCLKSDNNFRLTVQDHGRGIPENQRETVFEKYAQLSADDARVHGGIGLGLAICKNIIELHGGKIGVDSQEGEGSTFWFELPDSIIES